MEMSESKSEMAQLMRRIALEYEAAERGLTGFAEGSSKHQFITARLENIGACRERLAELVGDEQAAQLLCDAMEQELPAKSTPMLEIMLYTDQQVLLPELKALFPDLAKQRFICAQVYYVASLSDGSEGMRQRAFLSEHRLEYRNRTWQCEQSIRAFFSGVELEGKPIKWIEFDAIAGAQQVTIKTAGSEACFYFPPGWDPGSWQQGYGTLGWLYVYEAAEEVCASLVGVERCVAEQIKRTATPGEMARWLHDQGYTQVICTTTTPDVFGLYKPGDQ